MPRWPYLALALATVALGLTVRALLPGTAGKVAGVALYAVMMVWLVKCAHPGLGAVRAALIALALCWAIEFLQATDLPARINRAVPGARLVLGETFAWSDLAWYAVGVLVAGAGMRVNSADGSGT